MALPKVKQSCCGCTLETGSKVIAWLQIVGGILICISSLLAVFSKSSSANSAHGGHGTEGPGGSSYIVQLIGGIINCILGIVLLIGVQKRRPDYINLWVVINVVFVIIYVIGALIQGILLMVGGAIGAGITILIIGVIQTALMYYFLVVVSSFRKEIVPGANMGV